MKVFGKVIVVVIVVAPVPCGVAATTTVN